MSCQIKDYQGAPLKLSSVDPLHFPPSAVCKTVREMERLSGECWKRVSRREINEWQSNQTITSREWGESELSKTGGWKDAQDDNKDTIRADLWSCVDYSTLQTLIFLHQQERDAAAMFQHCPLQTRSGNTTVGGGKGLEWGIIRHLKRQMHLQIKQNRCKKSKA